MKSKYFTRSMLLVSFVAGGAAAQTGGTQGQKAIAGQLTGSDTLDTTIKFAIAELVAGGQIGSTDMTYNGLGSGQGQNQLEGGFANAAEPSCTPVNSTSLVDANNGCQEIAPMSRMLNNAICNDAESSGAEMLAICRDYIVVVTDNDSAQSYPGAAGCSNATSTPGLVGNAGKLGGTSKVLSTGYAIGAGGMEPWKDVLRLVYTGCKNTDNATKCVVAANRTTRCGNADRAALVSNWDAMFEGAACASGKCPNGLRRAYRRDDSSGTTSVFLGFIGVTAAIPQRSSTYDLGANTVAASNDHSFCDGGDVEGFLPNAAGLLGDPSFGDPIRTACTDEEDVCGGDGKMALVRAIRSVGVNWNQQASGTTQVIPDSIAYPTRMCTPKVFRKGQIANTGAKFCPDGTATVAASGAGNCLVPVDVLAPFTTSNPNFNCWNRKDSLPSGRSTNASSATFLDGRAYNVYLHTSGVKVDFSGTRNVDVGQWREQMVSAYPTQLQVTNPTLTLGCTERDATSNIGCIVGKTKCTLGYAGEEAAKLEPYASTNEALLIDASGIGGSGASPRDLERQLFIASIGGFENTTADCAARDGASSTFCNAQKELVNYFLSPAVGADSLTNAQRACAAGKFDVLPNGPACIPGTVTGGPGCGSSDGVCAAM